ncbi:MAG: thiosulfohydrolase SoxB [SAR116 cluster bacterium]|nr:thiosulfohydrolase SoxB [Paracoccaceae bacterium]RCL77691.1 MAG: thiosulfohydrolase SoxB [SAR116 cluster bacterium]RPH14533.1 MAG: thiosulfohydrolase SoxB [Alphaproteobacteria bacterium TMED150]
MYSRREFLQVTAATAAILGTNTPLGAWAAGQKITQDQLLDFEAKGNVTLLHLTDIHAQLVPVYFREPSVNLGVGEVNGLVPHITGQDFLTRYDLKRNTLDAYALTYLDFNEMAQVYGRVGGIDRMKTVVDAIRAERPENTLLLDGGDTWQGSYTSYKTQGMDMVQVMNALGVDAMTAHWEFTYGTDRVNELIEALDFPFLVGNVRDTEWDEPVFEAINYFERGGVKIAVIGQAFPYTPIANPRYMIPEYSFGIREEEMAKNVEKARANGAELVVVVSHNGFDTDRKMAQRVKGIDVLLSGHTHDAVPEAVQVGKTLLIASGSHGKFLSRLDLDVQGGEVRDYSFRLIPILSDVITPDPEMRKLVQEIRAPHEQELRRELAKTESTLFRRGNFNGTFDDLICDALLEERDAQIALSPGFRWGASLLPGQAITVEDVHNMTSITYPAAYRSGMTGNTLKEVLEDVADNLFNKDPYYQQGGDMVRVGGLGYTINPNGTAGNRVSNMQLLETGEPIQASKEYTVAGWASVNEGTEGPAIWDVVTNYLEKKQSVNITPRDHVKVTGV